MDGEQSHGQNVTDGEDQGHWPGGGQQSTWWEQFWT